LTEELDEERKREWLWWRIAVRYGIAAIIFVFFLTVSLHFRYTPDETYIHLQYGRNLAQGEGYSFNAGMPSNGLPGPLWALFIAVGYKFNLDPYIVAKTLDIIFASFSVFAILAFAFVLIRDHVYALVAAWIYSFDAWFLRWSGSGVEASLGVLLTLLVLWYSYRKEYMVASLVAGLLTLVRFEWGFLFVVVLLDLLLNGKNRAVIVKMLIGSVLVYAVVVGSWMVFSLTRGGGVLPNTLFANAGEGSATSSFWDAALAGLKVVGATQAVMTIALVGGVFLTAKRIGWHAVREDGVPIVWILLLPAILLLTGQNLGSKSLLPIIPLIVVYGVWGLKKLETTSLLPVQRGLLVLTIVAIFSLAQNQFVYHRWIYPHMEGVELGVNECLKPIAYWLRSNAPAGSTVLAPEIGVVGYISGRRVFDPEGTVDPSLRLAFRGITYDDAMVQRRYEQVLRPDFVIDRAAFPERLSSSNMRPVMTRTFSGRGVSKPETMYYTLYEVVRP